MPTFSFFWQIVALIVTYDFESVYRCQNFINLKYENYFLYKIIFSLSDITFEKVTKLRILMGFVSFSNMNTDW